MPSGRLRICKNGHRFYKSTACPTCPICEELRKPDDGFLSLFAAPARRALEQANIKSIHTLAKHSESEIASLHGIGLNAIKKMRQMLADARLRFKP